MRIHITGDLSEKLKALSQETDKTVTALTYEALNILLNSQPISSNEAMENTHEIQESKRR